MSNSVRGIVHDSVVFLTGSCHNTKEYCTSMTKLWCYQIPMAFHHNGPIPSQIIRFSTEIQNP